MNLSYFFNGRGVNISKIHHLFYDLLAGAPILAQVYILIHSHSYSSFSIVIPAEFGQLLSTYKFIHMSEVFYYIDNYR